MDLTTLALVTQWIGTLLTLCLLAFLAQSIRRPILRYWAAAWLALAVALGSLAMAFRHPQIQVPLEILYFFGEYMFAFLLIAGSLKIAPPEPRARPPLWWLPIALLTAIALALVSRDFNVQFALHAGIMCAAFGTAFRALGPARRARIGSGATIMSAALFLLALDFFHYVPVFALAAIRGPAHRFAYLSYTSVLDMVLEILLGFGMVILVPDTLRREAELANAELATALGRLEIAARTDPLTAALNRHAYQALIGDSGSSQVPAMRGCVVIADIDRLKQINDTHGHSAGDAAIRCVATAIRSVIRADDLLFRWGGDEFLVILWNMDESEASRRFGGFDAALRRTEPNLLTTLHLSVSFGFAAFDADRPLDRSIEIADQVMYESKGGGSC
jgi:diguanylate cyclase (GGDEF)-like protein